MRIIRNHPVIAFAVLAIAGLLAWGFWPSPVAVETVRAKRGPLTVAIEEEGRTRVIDRYTIAAPVDGITCRIDLNVGDTVRKGQILLTITPMVSQVLDARTRAQAQARANAARAALLSAGQQANAAKANEKLAQSELARVKPLAEKKLVSRDTLDKALTAVATASAASQSATFNVEVAHYELEAANSVLAYTGKSSSGALERVPVRSPIDGRILKVVRECETPVRTGEALLEVGNPSLLEVEVDLLSADAVKIKPGMPVEFERWGGDHPLQGVVRTVEPVAFTKVSALGVEEQRVLVIADFTSPRQEWQRLGDGYRVEARFIIWHQDSVLQVPAGSLFRYGDRWALFRVEGGRARRCIVTVGERNGMSAQILSGIKEGDIVINHPGDDLEDGIRVRAS